MPGPEFSSGDDLVLIAEAVRSAGAIARRYYGCKFKVWEKAEGSPVSEADVAIDSFLAERLTDARPDYGWLSEETADNSSRLSANRTFIVDPIDGTLAFVRHRPHFTICAAVSSGGRPIAGVVYNPISEEFYCAAAGRGAFCNGSAIVPSTTSKIEGCRMLADKGMLAHPAWSNVPNTPWPPMHVESRSSIAYRMALVARGDFDAMLALSAKHDWDLAAADIILTEAGACVTSHSGEILRYNRDVAVQTSVVAAGPALYPALIERVRHLKLPQKRQ